MSQLVAKIVALFEEKIWGAFWRFLALFDTKEGGFRFRTIEHTACVNQQNFVGRLDFPGFFADFATLNLTKKPSSQNQNEFFGSFKIERTW